MQLVPLGLEITADLIALGAAIAAWRAALEAKAATVATRRAGQAAIISDLLNQHSSDEMWEAFNILRRWRKEKGDEFAREFKRLREADPDETLPIDMARRRVAHYLRKVYHLQLHALLDRELLEAVMPLPTAEFCCEVIEPLEAAIRSNYEKDGYLWLARTYPVERHPELFPPSS